MADDYLPSPKDKKGLVEVDFTEKATGGKGEDGLLDKTFKKQKIEKESGLKVEKVKVLFPEKMAEA